MNRPAWISQYFGPLAIHQPHLQLLLNRFRGGSEAASRGILAAYDSYQEMAIPTPIVLDAGGGVRALMVGPGGLTRYGDPCEAAAPMADLKRAVRQLADDPDVGGILLIVNSPGGTCDGTDEFADEMYRARQMKPVFAYGQGLMCSAAYQIASQAQMIACNPGCITGSIGTLAVFYDLSRNFDAMGIRTIVLRTGKWKSIGIPGSEITDEEAGKMQELVEELNQIFIKNVARGRGFTKDRVEDLADGAVYLGAQAQSVGLVDLVQSLEATAAQLRQLVARKGALRSGKAIPAGGGGDEGSWPMAAGYGNYAGYGMNPLAPVLAKGAGPMAAAPAAAVTPSPAPALLPSPPVVRTFSAQDYRKAFAMRRRGNYPLEATDGDISKFQQLGLTPEEAVEYKHSRPATAQEMREAISSADQRTGHLPNASDDEISQFVARKMSAVDVVSFLKSRAMDNASRRGGGRSAGGFR